MLKSRMAVIESKCWACDGTGKKRGDSGKGRTNEDCPKCGGTGKIIFIEDLPGSKPWDENKKGPMPVGP